MTEKNIIFAIIIVLCILISFLEQTILICENDYIDLVEQFGMPDVFDPIGGAIWNTDNYKITLLNLQDGDKTTVSVTIPIKLFAGLNSRTVKISEQGKQKRIGEIIGVLPEHISYDHVAQTLTTCFDNIDTSMYVSLLCMKITTGELSQSDAKSMLNGETNFKTFDQFTYEYNGLCMSSADGSGLRH